MHASFQILFIQMSDDYVMNMNSPPTQKMLHLRKIYQIRENQNSQVNHKSFVNHHWSCFCVAKSNLSENAKRKT